MLCWAVDETKLDYFGLLGEVDHFKNVDPNFIYYHKEENLNKNAEAWYIHKMTAYLISLDDLEYLEKNSEYRRKDH